MLLTTDQYHWLGLLPTTNQISYDILRTKFGVLGYDHSRVMSNGGMRGKKTRKTVFIDLNTETLTSGQFQAPNSVNRKVKFQVSFFKVEESGNGIVGLLKLRVRLHNTSVYDYCIV